jgi:hypothetical protein
MDRLTDTRLEGAFIPGCTMLGLWKRLADYENTGLTPDEIAPLRAEVEQLRAGVAEADTLVCRLIERYEFGACSGIAFPCEWCSGNNCDSCRRKSNDDEHKVRFEMADLGFLEAARAALEKGAPDAKA